MCMPYATTLDDQVYPSPPSHNSPASPHPALAITYIMPQVSTKNMLIQYVGVIKRRWCGCVVNRCKFA